ncbi:hypothetical protein M0C34_14575 [Agarivorans sp. TSD2052]|nr:hypothetical protein [Agarivorans sp. TSD2052]UPW17454.1 hypothetical protein M0C34_14575 [Agarivorans sp. TSD2052]
MPLIAAQLTNGLQLTIKRSIKSTLTAITTKGRPANTPAECKENRNQGVS